MSTFTITAPMAKWNTHSHLLLMGSPHTQDGICGINDSDLCAAQLFTGRQMDCSTCITVQPALTCTCTKHEPPLSMQFKFPHWIYWYNWPALSRNRSYVNSVHHLFSLLTSFPPLSMQVRWDKHEGPVIFQVICAFSTTFVLQNAQITLEITGLIVYSQELLQIIILVL